MPRNPFQGDCLPGRSPLLAPGSGRPCLPFPHPWNYQRPLEILDSLFWGADDETGPGRHNRYLAVPGSPPIMVTRDPALIRAIATQTGDRPGQFDRDSLPSTGIARATGEDTLLFSNGSMWRRQRKLSAAPFGKTALFRNDVFGEFALTFRATVGERLGALREHVAQTGQRRVRVALEHEIKPVMLELLLANFFSASVPYSVVRERYVPALERVIEHIVRDTVVNRLGVPIGVWPGLTRRVRRVQADYAAFDELTSLALSARREGKGLWALFRSDASDDALRSNLKVFLAGALEATTSFAGWAISHLARSPEDQERVYHEVRNVEEYTPDTLAAAEHFSLVLEETLRLTPSLYFLPRRATEETWVEAADGSRMGMPKGTHILLDVWHANRHEDHWGVEKTGYPALAFAPDRWRQVRSNGKTPKEFLHYGFGHGARVCPGKHLGMLEVALVVGAVVKLLRFSAAGEECGVKAGVSTKPADGALVDLELR
ncbi:Epi-isozizaene 5-monooxygenase/(E)-beta-farnesene synthase [Pseudobythopirellula maris]|uniref:Epi-isozizaene 5-monooxygenase/(E)-beta-farnesene synthase n=1 Tax=Pseudobythopirellula maris TaxID=2527991 RepID=A0A5C5ZRW5_9BACT|nr:cytochrome P450 [Pseudobythopirellula maris]TWT89667.1 Epi-isozizaene 5-monooxygenase/(E)-beta-farnesene synthase [Pseudobythopirellula maris]